MRVDSWRRVSGMCQIKQWGKCYQLTENLTGCRKWRLKCYGFLKDVVLMDYPESPGCWTILDVFLLKACPECPKRQKSNLLM